ncbi:hypothetical protein M8J76_003935 [Diaphorina citri]|nr:hypothetical protein M8J76_003935 [Diaphorina citri]KAI5731909.1 hypothetical protein M8J77_018295 [Diaphorina citri]
MVLSQSTDPLKDQCNTVDMQRHFSDFTPSPLKSRRAKRIRFLCNGDKFFKGVVMAVGPERYRSFDSLLEELTRALAENINLPSGVRILFTMDGQKVTNIDELEDGKFYICSSSGDQFKKVDYAILNNNNSSNTLPRSGKFITKSAPPRVNKTPTSFVVRPRIIIVIRNGIRPRKVVRALLNKRNAPSLDQCFSTITDIVKLDTGAVRKVYTLNGNQLARLSDFFKSDDVFFAYGSERVLPDDFELDVEEVKAIQALKKDLRRPEHTKLKSGTTCLDASGREVPKMPTKTSVARCATATIKRRENLNIPSKLLQRYSVGQIIGDGNFAVVRQVYDKHKDMDCALKIIDKSKLLGKKQMIENEVNILRSVNHPNIIKLLDEYDTNNELYLVIELIKGGDLFDAISKNVKFSEEDSKFMTQSLASALSYLHDNYIVHRDIKPENLLVEMSGCHVKVLKVGDFGLAQRVLRPMFTVCGTPTYVAPEILNESGYGVKIDVWAAGVILYILLCGFPPFVSDTNDQDELFDDILSGQYGFPSPYWDDISEEAKELISHMLESNPDLRFSAEDVLDHPWLERS